MPRIVYVSWPATEISGGIKAAFQHVEMLVESGFDALLVSADGAMPGWFETTATLKQLDEVRPGDVLVFPENNPLLLQHFAGSPHRKVVFCQNPFLAHQGLAGNLSYSAYGVSHIMCPSHTVVHFCRRRFPGMKLGYTPFHVDAARFPYQANKTMQIVTVPRKRPMEFGAILDLFRAVYPQFRQLPWVYLHQASEGMVSDAMGKSAVFLSLARLEAHGMTKLEAMASGCIVAGFAGLHGGTDTATARNGFWADEDDIPGCVDQLGRAVQLAMDRGMVYDTMVAEGRRTAREYTRENSMKLLKTFWEQTISEMC